MSKLKQVEWTEIFGWYGVAAILCAYVLLSLGVVEAKNALYQSLNLTGALGIVVDSGRARDWQPMTLNIVWALVALVGLVRSFL